MRNTAARRTNLPSPAPRDRNSTHCDLDRDGRLDYLLDATDHYNVTETPTDPDWTWRSELATLSHNLSLRLAQLGRAEEALEAADASEALFRQLAAERPVLFTLSLGDALLNRGEILRSLGRPEGPLDSLAAAAAAHRRAGEIELGSARRELAASLDNQAILLHEIGRVDEALSAELEAIEIQNELASNDDEFRQLNRMKLNFALILRSIGMVDDALSLCEEAVAWARQLVNDRPTAYRFHLSQALHNLSLVLADLGRFDESLGAQLEVVQIRRSLADDRPASFAPALASALVNLGMSLQDRGDLEGALTATEEAAAVYRGLSHPFQGDVTRDLARCLTNQGILLNGLNRPESALPILEESVELCRRPDDAASAVDLATGLAALSVTRGRLGDLDSAIGATREAIRIWRRLGPEEAVFDPGRLTSALIQLGSLLVAADRREEAIRATREALEVCPPGEALTRQHLQRLAALSNLVEMLRADDRPEEALDLARQVERETRPHLDASPGIYRPVLAVALHGAGACLLALGRPAEAHANAAEAVRALRPVASADPERHGALLEAVLDGYRRAAEATGATPDEGIRTDRGSEGALSAPPPRPPRPPE